MAIQISGANIITNNKTIAGGTTGLQSQYDAINVGGTQTIVNRDLIYVTTNSQTITLPASPTAGNEVIIVPGNFTGTIVGRNAQNIMGLAENMTIDRAYAAVRFIFVDATRGWVIS